MRPILLVSLLLPFSAFAMQSMDDEQLSDTTGQAGVTITTALKVDPTATYRIVDTDGFTGYTQAAQLVMKNYGIDSGRLKYRYDAGSNGTSSVYTLGISLLDNQDIKLFLSELGMAATSGGVGGRYAVAGYNAVMKYNPTAAACTTAATCQKYTLLETIPGGEIRIDLGSQPKGDLMTIDSLKLERLTVNGGYSIVDASNGDLGMTIGGVVATGANDGPIDLHGTTYNLESDALVLKLGSNAKLNMRMTGMTAGTIGTATPGMGNLNIIGMDLSGATIRMKGH